MTKAEIAKNYFLEGYNCSQAVALAFMDELNLSKDDIAALTIGLGGGLARLRLTCGAVSAMAIVISYVKCKNLSKLDAYTIIQKACKEFTDEVGTLICGELLEGVPVKPGIAPEERTPEYYKKRPCAELVALAASIAEKYIND
ncbi:MAG: C_GCAxxG_C_C family protein [Clostridia bacterium]|nr:C_GCAxxG_C_C family protein [Clostridia bacterium]